MTLTGRDAGAAIADASRVGAVEVVLRVSAIVNLTLKCGLNLF
jgi:hypothetical protein